MDHYDEADLLAGWAGGDTTSLARPLSPALGGNIDHNGQDQDNPLDNLLPK